MSPLLRLYLPELDRTATDERCSCGHPRSAHDDELVAFEGQAVDVPGRGRCCEKGCPCRRFKWAAWVLSAKKGRGRSRGLSGVFAR